MTGISHALVTDLLTAHVDGALSASDCALVERHLADCPTCRADRRELSALAALVAGLPGPEMVPFGAFWARFERRLPRRRSWWPSASSRPRWVLAPALALGLLAAGMVGAAYASEGALPDNPLYPVKLLREDVELQLASGPVERNRLIARFADARLNEAAALVREGKDALAIRTVERFQDLVSRLDRPTGTNHEEESRLESFEAELNQVEATGEVTPAVRESVERARETVREQEREREDQNRLRDDPKSSD